MKNNGNMLKLVVVIILFVLSTSISAKNHNLILNTDETNDILTQINIAFDEAEQDVLDADPPSPEPLGPDPDPEKCVCGGTGVITHGDGHKTDCPYHKSKDETKGCSEDCNKECDAECKCGNDNSGCVEQAPKEATQPEHKYELYVFGGKFCGACRQMDKYVWQTLIDPKIYNQDSHKTMQTFLQDKKIKFKKYAWENKDDRKVFNKHGMHSLPAMILFKDGKAVITTKGYMSKDAIKSLIDKQISKGG